jgi:hypothetical protein
VWAASNIKPEVPGLKIAADAGGADVGAASEQRLVAFQDRPVETAYLRSNPSLEPASGDRASADPGATGIPRSQVVKIWLPQRSGTPPN